MCQEVMWEIAVTGTANHEWQGWVYFPASGKRWDFQSILELLRILEENGGISRPKWREKLSEL